MTTFRIDSFSQCNEDGSLIGVVLAKSGTQFITWSYSVFNSHEDIMNTCEVFNSDDVGCYNGHYFDTLHYAVKNFEERIKGMLTV